MVRLSHQNLSANAQQGMSQLKVDSSDTFLSLLPLSHVFELTAGFIVPLSKGASIVVPRVLAAKEIFTAMSENHVTVIIAVPRFFRTIYQNINQQTANAGILTKLYLRILASLPIPLRKRMNGPIRKKLVQKLVFGSVVELR
jgi:Long-chain acyl-CoA synthetases (AMP-forming)